MARHGAVLSGKVVSWSARSKRRDKRSRGALVLVALAIPIVRGGLQLRLALAGVFPCVGLHIFGKFFQFFRCGVLFFLIRKVVLIAPDADSSLQQGARHIRGLGGAKMKTGLAEGLERGTDTTVALDALEGQDTNVLSAEIGVHDDRLRDDTCRFCVR